MSKSQPFLTFFQAAGVCLTGLLCCVPLAGSAQTCGDVPFQILSVATNLSKVGFPAFTNATPPVERRFLAEHTQTVSNFYEHSWVNQTTTNTRVFDGGSEITDPGVYASSNIASYACTRDCTFESPFIDSYSTTYDGSSSMHHGEFDHRRRAVWLYNYTYEITNAYAFETVTGTLDSEGITHLENYSETHCYEIPTWTRFPPLAAEGWRHGTNEGSGSYFSGLMIVAGDEEITPTLATYTANPPPTGGSAVTTIQRTDEYTTTMLEEISLNGLNAVPFEAGGGLGLAFCQLTQDELSFSAGKARYTFQYETQPDESYILTRVFTIQEGTNAPTIKKLPQLLEGDGRTHWETNDIIPVLAGDGDILFMCGDEVLAHGGGPTLVTVALSDIELEPYLCASCGPAGGPGGAGPGSGGFFGSGGGGFVSTFAFSLGSGSHGLASGEVSVDYTSSTPALYAPGKLELLSMPGAITPVYSNDELRQVGSFSTLADIQTTVAGREYRITFYDANALIPGHDGQTLIPTNGLTALVTWTIGNPDANSSNRLHVIERRGSLVISNLISWEQAGETELLLGNGVRREILSESWDPSVQSRVLTRRVLDPSSGALLDQVADRYQTFSFGERLVERVEGSVGLHHTNTWAYFENEYETGAGLGNLKSTTNVQGEWQAFTYDAQGRLAETLSAFDQYSYRSVSYTYSSPLPGFSDNPSLWPLRPRKVEELADGYYLLSRSFFVAGTDYNIEIRSATYDDSQLLCTTNRYYPSGDPNAARLKSVERPDGTFSYYTYFTNSVYRTNVVQTGQPNAQRNGIVDGTRTVTVLGELGELLSSETYEVFPSAPNGVLAARNLYDYHDSLKQSHTVRRLDGTSNTVQYACCGIELEIDSNGATSEFFYDSLKRRIAVRENNFTITTTNLLDAAGRHVATIRKSATGSITTWQGAYDVLGRLTFETNALLGVTSYGYSTDSGRQVLTVTYPDGGTRIETRNLDGSLYEVRGTAVRPVSYSRSILTSYETYLDEQGDPTYETLTTEFDLLGRSTQVSGMGRLDNFYYNSKGQLWKQTDADYVATLRLYNARGNLEYVAIDMDRDDQVDFNGTDRITRTVRSAGPGTLDAGVNVVRQQTFVWTTDASATSNLLSATERAVSAPRSWSFGPSGTNRTQSAYYANGYRYVTNTAPDGSAAVSQFRYGRLEWQGSFDSAGTQLGSVVYTYDSHGRRQQAIDARNGATAYAYNNADLVQSVTTPPPAAGQPAQTTTTFYDAALRPYRVVLPDGGVVTNVFTLLGLKELEFGARAYAAGFEYDAQGRMTAMTNWSAFPSQGARVTRWNYDSSTGRLYSKQYPDATGPNYYYTSAGRLEGRSWARGVYTAYTQGYAGDLESVYYYDGTPSVAYTPDRLGRQKQIVQGDMTTTRFFDLAGNLLGEGYSGGALGGLRITNQYDHFQRRTNLALLNSQGGVIASTAFGYDSASRLRSVKSGDNSAWYSHLANSPLIRQIAFTNGSIWRMTTTRTYDFMNRLTDIANTGAQSASLSSFSYVYNQANQRTLRREQDGSHWRYDYDSLGQVKGGKRYWPDFTPVAGQQFEYVFDNIGNRLWTRAGGDENGSNLRTALYYPNLLNQYSSNTVPGAVDVMGVAFATSTVQVNNLSAYRKGEYFRKELAVNNSSGPVWTNVIVTATGQASVRGHAAVAPALQEFVHDADGNLTQDGLWLYTWDAENRLTAMESVYTWPDEAKRKLEFAYDHQGRRIEKIVSTWDAQWWSYVPAYTNRFVYDGWNLIAVLDCNNAAELSFSWGTDLSGSLQGAGGVGGLVSVTVHSGANAGTYFCGYDGNGNVAALVAASDGSVAARYEYGPFGELLRSTGPMAKGNPFRFSTKYQDEETDLLYYGYRYYNASTGRWLNRDLIEERGGMNLYCALGNRPVSIIDSLGLRIHIPTDTSNAAQLALKTVNALNKIIDGCGVVRLTPRREPRGMFQTLEIVAWEVQLFDFRKYRSSSDPCHNCPCLELLSQMVEDSKDVAILYEPDPNTSWTDNGKGSVGINPNFNVVLPEVNPQTGAVVDRQCDFGVALWHEFGHAFCDLKHPATGWNTVELHRPRDPTDPTIAFENIARGCLRSRGANIWDREPAYWSIHQPEFWKQLRRDTEFEFRSQGL